MLQNYGFSADSKSYPLIWHIEMQLAQTYETGAKIIGFSFLRKGITETLIGSIQKYLLIYS